MILKAIKKQVLRFLDWVVRDEKSEDIAEPEMMFSSGGMAVKGFMRDFKLISQIDPKHFSNGADRGPNISIGIGINNQLATAVAEAVSNDEEVLDEDEDVEVLTSEHDADEPMRRGFLTSKERFVEREEALILALNANQCIRQTHPSMLFSEDLF